MQYARLINESLNINRSFKKLRSPYSNESIQDMLLIQDLKVFDIGSEKVECANCGKFFLWTDWLLDRISHSRSRKICGSNSIFNSIMEL